MASLNMDGPYLLMPDKIDETITPKIPGNFALGYISETDFIVRYVGRAEEDLNALLKDWVFRKADCLFFKFSYSKTAQESFEKECVNWHDFEGSENLKNEKHPEPQPDKGWKCPRCGIYG